MLIKRLRASGLLSFGAEGVDLELGRLNVLIGPNGSGKSNLIELIALLQASPSRIMDALAGGIREWLWRGASKVVEGYLEAEIVNPAGPMDLRHVLSVAERGNRFELADERIEYERPYEGKPKPYYFYNYRRGHPELKEAGPRDLQLLPDSESPGRQLDRASVIPDQSILSQLKDPERYPVLRRLQEAYGSIRIYRNWFMGPGSPLRRPQTSAGRLDWVEENLSNYQRVVWDLRKNQQDELLEYLSTLYEGAEELHLDTLADTVLLSVRERAIGYVPVTRLSDGTLRYLCLLAILLAPSPPELVVIDEPDLGLHPDLMPTLVKLLVNASERTQVIVTTHSRVLVDALSGCPDSVLVCGKDEAGTFFERLDPNALEAWLERYSLGQLWSRGDLGGNRW